MIVRKEANGEMLLLAQTDHSRLAGQFAAHWGNAQFAPLTPYESVARAAAFHDFGYLRYETAPAFDEMTGGTPMFRNVLTDERRLEEYQWCPDWLLALDPYAALLVSMHRTGLWRERYKTISSAMHNVKKQKPEVEAFIERQEALRPQLIARYGFDPQQLWINYRLLQVWDLMSLAFSLHAPEPETFEPVPVSYADGEKDGVRITMTPVDATTVAIDPYPFDEPALRVAVPVRRLPQSTFASQDAFRKAYFCGQLELLEFRLVSAADAGIPEHGKLQGLAV
jgi:hypothetical protein